MKFDGFSQNTNDELLNSYWSRERQVSCLANQYGYSTDEELIAHSMNLPADVRHHLGKLLWEIVHILHEYNHRKKKNRLRVIDGGKR